LGNTVTLIATVTGGTPVSYNWNFGDGNTSTLPVVIYKYNNTGTFTPTLTVNLSGGGSCNATGQPITVHALPIVNYVIRSKDSLCFKNNQLCIQDLSVPGPSGAPIRQRVWQLSNGYLQIDNAPLQANICYENTVDFFGHRYTMVLEVTDTNGCVSRLEKKDSVYLHPRWQPIGFTTSIFPRCDSTPVTFINQTQQPFSQIKKFMWVFGDGRRDSTRWSNFNHFYKVVGTYDPSLIVTGRDNCVDTVTLMGGGKHDSVYRTITTIKKYNSTNPALNCFHRNFFEFSNLTPGVLKWYIIRNGKIIDSILPPNNSRIEYSFPDCGQYTVRLSVNYANCPFVVDTTLDITGPNADIQNDTIKPKNVPQCAIHDTVYFRNPVPYISCHYQNPSMKWLWDFGDQFAPPCTTDRKNNINVNVNCRYSVDSFNVKHRYYDGKENCYMVKLIMTDTVTGCFDRDSITIALTPPDAGWDSTITPVRRGLYWEGQDCLNSIITFKFDEILPACGAERIWINFDTACGNWQLLDTTKPVRFLNHVYTKTCDPNGYVTVGLIVRNGSDGNNTCYDTAYYPFFRFIPKNPLVTYNVLSTCKPYEVEFRLIDTNQANLDYVFWDLISGASHPLGYGIDTFWQIMNGDSMIKRQRYTYLRSGAYTGFLAIKDIKGCLESSFFPIGIGFWGEFGVMKDVLCVNEPFILFDNNRYFRSDGQKNPTDFWADPARIAAGKELIWWNLGDGKGFVHTGPRPVVSYSKPGVYTVSMAIKDSLNCFDTIVYPNFITVIEPDARIYTPTSLFFCAPEIVAFKDSSAIIDSFGNEIVSPPDFIQQWEWDFGDFKQPKVLQHPSHDFTSNDSFQVRLVVTTAMGCRDTAYKWIEVRGPKPRFEIEDTIGCRPFTVKFKNTTPTKLLNWIWYFGDSANTTAPVLNDSDITFTYNQAGIYRVRLLGLDTLRNPFTGNLETCTSIFPDTLTDLPSRRIYVNPTPRMNMISTDSVCPNTDVNFTANGDALYNKYQWLFGDNNSSITSRPDTVATHAYAAPGVYTVTLIPDDSTTALICRDTIRKNIVVQDVKADFEIDESTAPQYQLVNKSLQATRYEWYDKKDQLLGSNPFSTALNPTYRYTRDTIQFDICLVAYSPENCWDSICKSVYFLSKIKMPNVFTPGDNNGLNDAFDIDIVGYTHYHLRIYNRWGGLVFEGLKDGLGNDGVNWNGRMQNEGDECPAGVYYYIFDYKLITDEKIKSVNGTVTLIR
jgi:gliding motility-associated-like protein